MDQLTEEDIYGHLLLLTVMVTHTAHLSVAAPTLAPTTTPDDVDHDYFCDSNGQYSKEDGETRDDDDLWDGEGCGLNSSYCEWNDPPHFCKSLNYITFEDLEIRLFTFYFHTTVSVIEIFVK